MVEIVRPLEQHLRSKIDTVYRSRVHSHLTRGEGSKDREIAHERALEMAEKIQNHELALSIASRIFAYKDPILQTQFAGVDLPNPLGIAAGFDKNARIHRFLGKAQGFGIVTVGSATKEEWDGNEKPRIFDLPFSDGVINRMGFPGKGADKIEQKLKEDDPKSRTYGLVLNLAASKPSFERGTAIEDYVAVARQLLPYGDLHEINVSSPNTPGVRDLQEPEVFAELASAMAEVYRGENGLPIKPYIFKFGPDLPDAMLQRDVRTAIDTGASGISLTNTTTDRDIKDGLSRRDIYRQEAGGISGRPLREKALKVSNMVYKYTGGEIEIKGAGGIATAEDAWNSLTRGGATIVDVYTAYVRSDSSTPNFTHHVNSDIARAMRSYNMTSMEDFKDIRGRNMPFPTAK